MNLRTSVLPHLSSVCRRPLDRSEEKYFSEPDLPSLGANLSRITLVIYRMRVLAEE